MTSEVIPIGHVTLIDGIVCVAYLERGYYADGETSLPDFGAQTVVFDNKDTDFAFNRGQSFVFIDKVLGIEPIFLIVSKSESDENGLFEARLIAAALDDEAAPQTKPKLSVVRTSES